MTLYTVEKLKKGKDAAIHIFNTYARTGHLPSNFQELMPLPVEVQNHSTGTSTLKTIGDLSPDDLENLALTLSKEAA